MHPCIPRLARPWLSAAAHALALCSACLASSSAFAAITTMITFENYVHDTTAVGKDDPDLAGTAVWKAWNGNDSSRFKGFREAENGPRYLRLADGNGAAAYSYHLDVAAAEGVDYAKPCTVSFDLRLSSVWPGDGLRRVRVELGRLSVVDTSELARGWFIFEVVGDEMRLVVFKRDASGQQAVRVGKIKAGAWVHVAVTVDQSRKRYVNVVVDGVDVTSAVDAAGDLPWKRYSSDGTLPNSSLWISSGLLPTTTIDLDNVRISNDAEKWAATSATSDGVGAEWLQYLTSGANLKVAHDTALDFGTKLKLNRHAFGDGHAKIAERGFARVDQDGDLSFANGEKVRLFCASEVMLHFPVPDDAPEPVLQSYVDQIARAGYNAYRPHFLDVYLMQGATENAVFNMTRFARWQKLVKMLRQKGIYLILDASTSWNSFSKEPLPSHCGLTAAQCAASHGASVGYRYQTDEARRQRINVRMLWTDPDGLAARAQWKAGVKLLYETVNDQIQPGIALKDDPQVILTNLRNESGFFFRLLSDNVEDPRLSEEPGLLKCWSKWLEAAYGTIAKLNEAWPVPDYDSFDEVPLPLVSEDGREAKMNRRGVRIRDLRRFEVDKDQELFVWMQQTLRDIGVKSLLVDCNNWLDGPSARVRDIMPGVDIHSYHDHDEDGTGDIAKVIKNTSAGDDALGIVRNAGQVRQHGRPLTVTEWGQPFWNSFRHESGLAFPSYAALGAWSMIAQHARPIGDFDSLGNLPVKAAENFQLRYDPAAKAAEYMSALLYGRGDVRASQQRVELLVDHTAVVDHSAGSDYTFDSDTWGLAYPYNMLPLFARLGMTIKPTYLMRDGFDNGVLTDATFVEPSLDWLSEAAFWNQVGTTGGSATFTGGKLVLSSGPQAAARHMVRSLQHPTPVLDVFAYPRTFLIKGLDFTNNLTSGERVFRFSIANGLSLDPSDNITFVLLGNNVIRMGYKINGVSRSLPDIYNQTLQTGAKIVGVSFTPIAGDLNESAPGQEFDPVYDLVVYLDTSNGGPAYVHLTGRWHAGLGLQQPRLPAGGWPNSNNTMQVQVQKLNSQDTQNSFSVSVDEVAVFPRQTGPRPLTLANTKSLEYPPPASAPMSSAALIEKLISDEILGAETRTRAPSSDLKPERYLSGAYESATKELYHEPAKRLFTVITDRSEGAVLPATLADGSAGQTSVELKQVKIANRNAPHRPASVSVLVSSLEPETSATKNVNDSGRLLLIVASDALNTGQTFGDHRRLTLLKSGGHPQWGTIPVLLRRASVEVRIRRINSTALKVYPLKPDGTRHAKALGGVTTLTDESGTWLVVPIDTGALVGEDGLPGVNGPAMFFEIVPST